MAEVAGRGPGARDVAEEADRVDVQIDLGVRGRQPRPLGEREPERQHGERRHEESIAHPQGGEHTSRAAPSPIADTVSPLIGRAILAALVLLGPVVLTFAKGGYFDVPRLVAGVGACLLVAAAALIAPLPRDRASLTALAGLAALTAWTGASIAWAPLNDPATADFERLLLY